MPTLKPKAGYTYADGVLTLPKIAPSIITFDNLWAMRRKRFLQWWARNDKAAWSTETGHPDKVDTAGRPAVSMQVLGGPLLSPMTCFVTSDCYIAWNDTPTLDRCGTLDVFAPDRTQWQWRHVFTVRQQSESMVVYRPRIRGHHKHRPWAHRTPVYGYMRADRSLMTRQEQRLCRAYSLIEDAKAGRFELHLDTATNTCRWRTCGRAGNVACTLQSSLPSYDSRGRHCYAIPAKDWVRLLRDNNWGDHSVAAARRLLRQLHSISDVAQISCVLPKCEGRIRHLSGGISVVVPSPRGYTIVWFTILPDRCISMSGTSSGCMAVSSPDMHFHRAELGEEMWWIDSNGFTRCVKTRDNHWESLSHEQVRNWPTNKRRVLVSCLVVRDGRIVADKSFAPKQLSPFMVNSGVRDQYWWTTADEAAAWASLTLLTAGLPMA